MSAILQQVLHIYNTLWILERWLKSMLVPGPVCQSSKPKKCCDFNDLQRISPLSTVL